MQLVMLAYKSRLLDTQPSGNSIAAKLLEKKVTPGVVHQGVFLLWMVATKWRFPL
ncbi:MAG: hypothetical protein F6K42_32895 [Leptolyngbya sp. SIO1D8]|nr:hypothetical protein [Leptolyngbya sp. SIO1D8]